MTATYLTAKDGIYVWTGGYDTKTVPKAAGMRWHGQDCRQRNCPACAAGVVKRWWTDRADVTAKLRCYADAQALAALAPRETSVACSRAEASDDSTVWPVPVGLSYLPYQRVAISYASTRNNVLLADDCGLGKSVESLGIINADPTVKTVLIVCPASLRINWSREATKWLVRPLRTQVMLKSEAVDPDSELVILSYQLLRGDVLAQLMTRRWNVLIVDEAHRVKNKRGAAQAKAVLGSWDKTARRQVPGLVQVSRRRLFLTGTPLPNGRPIEIWPLLAALAPAEFKDWMAYVKRYCGYSKTKWGVDVSGAERLPELQERMRATVCVRRVKADVLAELPPKRRELIILPANGAAAAVSAERAVFSEVERAQLAVDRFATMPAERPSFSDPIEVWPLLAALPPVSAPAERAPADRLGVSDANARAESEAYAAAIAALRAAQKVAFAEVAEMRRAVAEAKIPQALEHIQAIVDETESKVVVFCHHRSVVDALHEGLRDENDADDVEGCSVVIDGRMSSAEKQASVDAFQDDPAVRVCIASITAAGVGITLTAADRAVFVESSWVPGDLTQCEDRLHRIGQQKHVLVQHLVFDGSIDATMLAATLEKQEHADAALDIRGVPAEELPALPEPRVRPEVPAVGEARRERVHADARALADRHGVSVPNINKIVNNKIWRADAIGE
jgi:SWI/SNF-related matrix-associated actin-dependent regulator of chromatin subfamily A-like protein 1